MGVITGLGDARVCNCAEFLESWAVEYRQKDEIEMAEAFRAASKLLRDRPGRAPQCDPFPKDNRCPCSHALNVHYESGPSLPCTLCDCGNFGSKRVPRGTFEKDRLKGILHAMCLCKVKESVIPEKINCLPSGRPCCCEKYGAFDPHPEVRCAWGVHSLIDAL